MLAGDPMLRSFTATKEQRAMTFACLGGAPSPETNGFPNKNCPKYVSINIEWWHPILKLSIVVSVFRFSSPVVGTAETWILPTTSPIWPTPMVLIAANVPRPTRSASSRSSMRLCTLSMISRTSGTTTSSLSSWPTVTQLDTVRHLIYLNGERIFF